MNLLVWLLLISVRSMFYFHLDKQRDATWIQDLSRDHFVSIACDIIALEVPQKSNLSLGIMKFLFM